MRFWAAVVVGGTVVLLRSGQDLDCLLLLPVHIRTDRTHRYSPRRWRTENSPSFLSLHCCTRVSCWQSRTILPGEQSSRSVPVPW